MRPPRTYRILFDTRPSETVVSIVICLIHQADDLLEKLLRQLDHTFFKKGDLREGMTRARLQ